MLRWSVCFGQDSSMNVSAFDLIEINGYKFLKTDRKSFFSGRASINYNNGSRQCELIYLRGKLDGEIKCWFENGKQISKATYKNGQLNGPYAEWDSTGNPTIEGQYKDELKEGVWFYYKNGIKEISGWYKNDRKNGVWLYYNLSGKVIKQEFFDDNGNKYKEVVNDQN